MRPLLFAAVFALAGCVSTNVARPDEGFARLHWPQTTPDIGYPHVVLHPDGRRTVEATVPPSDLQPAYVAAEEAFHAGDCSKAADRYREILARAPEFYPALLGLGDCALRNRDARGAIERYHEARRINPDDFLVWFSEGDARLQTGNFGEARELLTQALVLRPRRFSVLQTLHAVSARIGVTIDDVPLSPAAWFKDRKNLYVQREVEWWGRYALCKQLACTDRDLDLCKLGERTVTPPVPWSAPAESACLRLAAQVYRQRRGGAREPALERFLAADQAGLADAYAVYEIGTRIDPQMVLELPPEKRREVEQYVRSFVILDRRQ